MDASAFEALLGRLTHIRSIDMLRYQTRFGIRLSQLVSREAILDHLTEIAMIAACERRREETGQIDFDWVENLPLVELVSYALDIDGLDLDALAAQVAADKS